MKIYGMDETKLKLTEAAQKAYEACGNLIIEEYYKPGYIEGQRYVRGRMAYNIKGDWQGRELTEVGVNDFLEDMYDDMMALGEEMKGGTQG